MNNINKKIKKYFGKNNDINAKDNDGRTALMKASAYGQNEVVEALIENGADVNIIDNYNNTALIYASIFGHNEVVKTILIDYQAKVSEEDKLTLKEHNCTFTLNLINKIDLEKQLQQEIK